MSDALSIDLNKLRALVVENTGPGKTWTRRKLSLAATENRNPDLIRNLMNVVNRKPTIEAASGICAALGVPLTYVMKGLIEPSTSADDWMPVIGSVAAGVWRESAEWPMDERYQVEVGASTGEGDRFGLVVDGRSMDRTLPPGAILECINLIGSDLTPELGDYVIVERVKAGFYERTVKRLSRSASGDYELVAESTLPEFQNAIPIGRPEPGKVGDDETRIVALVTRAHLVLHRSGRRVA